MTENKQEDGQVSESGRLEQDADISDGDAVAGQSDGADEGPTGPDAPTYADDQDEHPDKSDVETTG